jgi:hypothetical protein
VKTVREFLAVGFFLIPVSLSATSFIAIRTPQGVFVGVDSKPTYRGAPGNLWVCKIYKSGSMYFSIIGLDHDAVRHFFPKNIIASAVATTHDFAKVTEAADEQLKGALLSTLDAQKSEDPDTYRFTTKHANQVMTVFFFEMVGSVLFSSSSTFTFSEANHSISVEHQRCPGSDCPNGTYTYYTVDETGAGKDFLSKASGYSPVDAISSFIDIEAKELPETVGGPKTILRIDGNGPSWISNSVGCPIEVNASQSN